MAAKDELIRIVLWLKPAEIEVIRQLIREQDFRLQITCEYIEAVLEAERGVH